MEIIGYSYEADTHCVGCALARFGLEQTGPRGSWVTESARDSNGNPVHPIFTWDEYPLPLVCGTCGGVIREGL